MRSPIPAFAIHPILSGFRDKPELRPVAAELLGQAIKALRATIHRAADTDLALLLAGNGDGNDNGETGSEVAGVSIPGDESSGAGQTLAEATARFQVQYIGRTIEQSEGNVSRAADRLGLHRSNLYRKMRQLGMALPELG